MGLLEWVGLPGEQESIIIEAHRNSEGNLAVKTRDKQSWEGVDFGAGCKLSGGSRGGGGVTAM